MQVIQQDLKAIVIQLTPDNLAAPDFDTRLFNGDFQLAYYDQTGGPTPFYELRQWLYSGNSAPIGKAAATNWERYNSPSTDKLIAEYGATTSSATQHQVVNELQQVMLKEVPVIPVTEGVDWYQYNTSTFTGWVTQGNLLAQPAAW